MCVYAAAQLEVESVLHCNGGEQDCKGEKDSFVRFDLIENVLNHAFARTHTHAHCFNLQ